MQLIATRSDSWQLYRAGEQYFESSIKIDDGKLSTDGGERLRNGGTLRQLAFNQESIKGWFNKGEPGETAQQILCAIEPIIIKSWQENKLDSWILETY